MMMTICSQILKSSWTKKEEIFEKIYFLVVKLLAFKFAWLLVTGGTMEELLLLAESVL